jgi:hypothetical protein
MNRDFAAWAVIGGLMAIETAIFVKVNMDSYPTYPLPLHPGTQVIDTQPDLWNPHRFKFINSTATIQIETAVTGTDCKRDVQVLGTVRGDGEVTIQSVEGIHRDFCVTVEAGQFPMVLECWRPSNMGGGQAGCGRWRD